VEPQRILEIARHINSGDREAFAFIVEEYQHFVYNFSLRLTGNRDSAYDLASEVFLRVFQQLSKYRPDYPFKSWLGRVTYTTGLNFLRKRRGEIQLDALTDDVPFEVRDDSHLPEEIVLDEATKKEIQVAIMKLKTDFRAIIILCDIEEVSYEDTANILGIPMGTVRSRLSRARDALRKILNGT